MSNFKLSTASEEKLAGVHPDLVKVVRRALTLSPVDFKVIEGVRTLARQKELFAKKATKTMNSRHLTGHAVDLVPLPLDWNNRQAFESVAKAMQQAAKQLGIAIRWGGDWNMNGSSTDEKFYDGPHFELLRAVYP
ncbi:MAG: M15 family metallopeptidase [Haemophilus parahaemolyticus]|uniref:M15 family metallopeptidase n=1 Tax=Haemophilus parahaemolyticus TaxID=735 RepID=UPI0026F162A4|nr:M15 family metallopeptidase [Haemophilus parahaemolyticus]MBS6009596.1 M15 family metallopeptidase [Haemophilus parahaemolyticus]